MAKTKDYVIEQLLFILERACREGFVTSFHLNEDLLGFIEKFYPDDFDKGRRAFVRRCNRLVELGFLHRGRKSGTGFLGYYDFGVRVLTEWKIKDKYFHNFNEAKEALLSQLKRKVKNDID